MQFSVLSRDTATEGRGVIPLLLEKQRYDSTIYMSVVTCTCHLHAPVRLYDHGPTYGVHTLADHVADAVQRTRLPGSSGATPQLYAVALSGCHMPHINGTLPLRDHTICVLAPEPGGELYIPKVEAKRHESAAVRGQRRPS